MIPPFVCLRTVRPLFAGFAAVLLAVCRLGAEPAAAAASPDAAAQYFVFEGIEVLANYDGAYPRVFGVHRSSLQLQVGSATALVPIRQVQRYRTLRATKFSTVRATIDKLRATSLRIAFDREMAELEFSAASNIRQREFDLEREKADLMISQMALGARPTDAAKETRIVEEGERIANLRDVMSDYSTNRADDLERDATPANFEPASVRNLPFDYTYDSLADGLQFKCEISSPDPVDEAFLAVTLRFVDTRRPLRSLQRFEIQPVGRVGPKPRKVKVELRNLPRGFHLIDCRLHLYGGGQELATNLSAKQRVLTEAQLLEYFLSDYLARNRNTTRPPQSLLLARRDEVLRGLKAAELQQGIYATIDRNGVVVSLSKDESGEQELPPQFLSVMRRVRFFPGLQDGNAVESRVKFRLSDLLGP